MTHKQFKPETTALVLIDYQVGTLQLIKTLSSDQSLRNAVMLAKAAKALGMPVVLTTSQDKIQGPLPLHLRPSMSAMDAGLEVQAVMDASGSSYEIQEDMSRRRMERAGVVLTTTNTIIAELVQDWSTPEGMELVKLLVATVPMMQPAD